MCVCVCGAHFAQTVSYEDEVNSTETKLRDCEKHVHYIPTEQHKEYFSPDRATDQN